MTTPKTSESPAASHIHAALDGPVWHITLARPQQRNALTPEMVAALLQAIQSTPSQARVLLLRGEGKVFCAGFDLERSQGEAGISVVRDLLTGLHASVMAMASLSVPVVVCVQGAAIAGGCALLTAADAVISHAAAQFGYPAARLGLSPAVSAPTLAQHTGFGAARALQLDGGLISGERALAIGLVTQIVELDAISAQGLSVARNLASKPEASLAATRNLLQSLAPMLSPESGIGKAALQASLRGTGTPEQLELLAKAWGITQTKTVQKS